MKKEKRSMVMIVMLSILLAMLMPQVVNGIGFIDVGIDKWYYQDIKEIKELGIINGYEDNSYRPENTITKIEALKIVIESKDDNSISFMEDQDKWYKSYLAYGKSLGIDIKELDEPIRRQEVAEYIVKVYDKKIQAAENILFDTKDVYMEKLYKDGIIIGLALKEDKAIVNPNGYLTRAEMAALVNRMINKPITKEEVKSSLKENKSNLPKEVMIHKVDYPVTQQQYEAEFLDMIEKREFTRKIMFDSRKSNEDLKNYYQLVTNAYYSIIPKYPEYMTYVGMNLELVYDEKTMGVIISLTSPRNLVSEDNKSPGEMLDIFELEARKLINELQEQGKINENQSESEKARVLYSWVVKNTKYINNNSIETYSGYGQIVNGQAVCQGYTSSYNYLLRLVGIEDVKGIDGYSSGASGWGPHLWTQATLDGKRVLIDVTWGDPDQGDRVDYKYFDISEMELRKTHSW